MRPIFLFLCLFISFNAAFAQNSSAKGSAPSPGKPEDSTIATLSSDGNGHPGYIVKNAKGQTEFKSIDEYEKSRASVQSKNNLSRATVVNAITNKAVSPANKSKETAVANRMAGRDSTAMNQPNKLPPPLTQESSQH